MEAWEQNEHVQIFLNEENLTQQQYANAYYVRDTQGFNSSFDEIYNHVLKKLGLTDFETHVKNAIIHTGTIMLREKVMMKSYRTLMDNFKPNVNNRYSANIDLTIRINEILDINRKNHERLKELEGITDLRTLYSKLTIEEFIVLGW